MYFIDEESDFQIKIGRHLLSPSVVEFYLEINGSRPHFMPWSHLKQLSEKLAWYIESEEEEAAYDLQSANS